MPKNVSKRLFYKDFIGILRWHEGCNTDRIPSRPSEMTAMNSTLLLLNALALAVLVIFNFQPEHDPAEPTAEIADTYKPLQQPPQLAVMTHANNGAPHLTAEPASDAVQNEHWVF